MQTLLTETFVLDIFFASFVYFCETDVPVVEMGKPAIEIREWILHVLSRLFSVYGTKFMPMQYALLNELYYLFYQFNFLYIEPSFSLLFFTGVISNILELFFFPKVLLNLMVCL